MYEPFISDKAKEYLNDCINSNWISWQGKYVDVCCEKLRTLVGRNYCILTNSGTSAVHLAVRTFFHFYPNINKIVFPSSAYIAAYSPFFFGGSISQEIVLSDITVDTWNPDYTNIDADENTLFVVVHNGGNVVNVKELRRRYPKSLIFEDNCEGMFGTYEGERTGSASDISVCSFFANKNITSGEGGCIFFSDQDQYEFALKIRGQGQSDEKFVHDEMGYNYRMTNIQAAVLLSQLDDIDNILDRKNQIFSKYIDFFSSLNHVHIPTSDNDCTGSRWLFGVTIDFSGSYQAMSKLLSDSKIETRPMFYPYSKHGWLPKPTNYKEEVTAKLVADRSILLPSHPRLNNHDIEYICSRFTKCLNIQFKNQ